VYVVSSYQDICKGIHNVLYCALSTTIVVQHITCTGGFGSGEIDAAAEETEAAAAAAEAEAVLFDAAAAATAAAEAEAAAHERACFDKEDCKSFCKVTHTRLLSSVSVRVAAMPLVGF